MASRILRAVDGSVGDSGVTARMVLSLNPSCNVFPPLAGDPARLPERCSIDCIWDCGRPVGLLCCSEDLGSIAMVAHGPTTANQLLASLQMRIGRSHLAAILTDWILLSGPL